MSSDSWKDACEALRLAMKAELNDPDFPQGEDGHFVPETKERQWVIFFDTDHEIHTLHAMLALGTADKLIIPLSMDDNDYDRLFVGEIALFPIVEKLYNAGYLKARIDKFIFNRVRVVNNLPYREEGISRHVLPFTPAQSDLNSIKMIVQVD